MSRSETALAELLAEIRACRKCIEHPRGEPLPHPPRPVVQAGATARILLAGQAPGTRVHQSGRPFTDPSGDRLRRWLGIGPEIFYDESRVAILPMGFCFPGLSAGGADLPPRSECAPAWRARLVGQLPAIRLIVTLGLPAARWHLGERARPGLRDTVAAWKDYCTLTPPVFALPHPSWRNNALLARNPFIAAELIPALQEAVRDALQ